MAFKAFASAISKTVAPFAASGLLASCGIFPGIPGPFDGIPGPVLPLVCGRFTSAIFIEFSAKAADCPKSLPKGCSS